ncbi:hypothetical protein B0H13DRAFT_2367932 [Mycena leptocephala]|nr:hypothetical protein B0H13DRAFT_2367932 [Mycena leptocephala]
MSLEVHARRAVRITTRTATRMHSAGAGLPWSPLSVLRGTFTPTPTVTARRARSGASPAPSPRVPHCPRRRRCLAAHPDRLLLGFASRDCHQRRSASIRPRIIAPPPCSARRRRSLSTAASPSPVPFTTILIIAIRASGTPLMRGEPACTTILVRSAPAAIRDHITRRRRAPQLQRRFLIRMPPSSHGQILLNSVITYRCSPIVLVHTTFRVTQRPAAVPHRARRLHRLPRRMTVSHRQRRLLVRSGVLGAIPLPLIDAWPWMHPKIAHRAPSEGCL